MFLGLPQFNKEALLASLLTFRFVYFMLPLFMAGAVLGLHESLSPMARLSLPRSVWPIRTAMPEESELR